MAFGVTLGAFLPSGVSLPSPPCTRQESWLTSPTVQFLAFDGRICTRREGAGLENPARKHFFPFLTFQLNFVTDMHLTSLFSAALTLFLSNTS